MYALRLLPNYIPAIYNELLCLFLFSPSLGELEEAVDIIEPLDATLLDLLRSST